MNRPAAALLAILCAFTMVRATQNANTPTVTRNANQANSNRKPIFRATKDQIKQAQAIIKQRGYYAGEQSGTLDTQTRAGLKKFQDAEKLKVTGTLNRVTLEKMGIALTEQQKAL